MKVLKEQQLQVSKKITEKSLKLYGYVIKGGEEHIY